MRSPNLGREFGGGGDLALVNIHAEVCHGLINVRLCMTF